MLGTHTFVDSFVSPFLFFALFWILQIQNSKQEFLRNQTNSEMNIHTPNHSHQSNGNGHAFMRNGHSAHGLPSARPKHNSIRKGVINVSKVFVSGSILGIICYIRYHSIVFIFLFFLTIYIPRTVLHLPSIFVTLIGVCFGVCIGGLHDHLYYDIYFSTMLQWYRTNILLNPINLLLGTGGYETYMSEIFTNDVFTCVFQLLLISGLYFVYRNDWFSPWTDLRDIAFLVFLNITVFCANCVTVSKDVRFLHDLFVINLILAAKVFHFVIVQLKWKYAYIGKSIYVLLGAFVLNSYLNFPSTASGIRSVWTWKASFSSEINTCMMYVSTRDDVLGVAIDDNLYHVAGFSVLNHDVPLLVLIQNEYHEYSINSSASSENKRFRTINKFSDYIHVSNVLYLSKFLLENLKYNYVVTKERRKDSFEDLGYQEVYSFGTHMVLHRTLSMKGIRKSKQYAAELKFGDNATVLEYEASWLYSIGLYDKAVARAHAAMEISDARIRLFQILGLSYSKMNRPQEAYLTESKCFKRHGKKACQEPQSRIFL